MKIPNKKPVVTITDIDPEKIEALKAALRYKALRSGVISKKVRNLLIKQYLQGICVACDDYDNIPTKLSLQE